MNLTRTAYGTWSGGRYMHFGETMSEERYRDSIKLAYEEGIRTFVTADVYGQGRADTALGEALADYDRDTYCLVGMLGHDFYEGERQGSAGYPRFTNPEMRDASEYESFLKSACEKSLQRCRTDHFDLLMLHNPDEFGYTSEAVWKAMEGLRSAGLTEQLGIAPGPANGFTLDLVQTFEKFGSSIDWAMIILNPLEPWPGQHVLEAAKKNGVDILTRVLDYGGLFHDDLTGAADLKPGDHRAYRPEGWIERGRESMEKMRTTAEKHELTMLQFAATWNLSQEPVKCTVPTFIQEAGEGKMTIEEQIKSFAALPEEAKLSAEEVEAIREIGDNTGCMQLKGASERHDGGSERPDEWAMRDDLLQVAAQFGLPQNW